MSDYRTFWRVDQAVFQTPLPAHSTFATAQLKSLRSRIQTFCNTKQNLMLILGEAGSGKSTIAKWIFESIPQDTHDIVLTSLVQKETAPGWLGRRISEHLGIETNTLDVATRLGLVARKLEEFIAEKRQLLLVVDASHLAVNADSLSEISGLLNLQTLSMNCLSFILIGDFTLRVTVESTHDLAAKVSQVGELRPLTQAETMEYIDWKCQLAGIKNPFDSEATAAIYDKTSGNFALINSCCENCLIAAFERQEEAISSSIVNGITTQLLTQKSNKPNPSHQSPTRTNKPSKNPKEANPTQQQSPSSSDRSSTAPKLTSLFKTDPE